MRSTTTPCALSVIPTNPPGANRGEPSGFRPITNHMTKTHFPSFRPPRTSQSAALRHPASRSAMTTASAFEMSAAIAGMAYANATTSTNAAIWDKVSNERKLRGCPVRRRSPAPGARPRVQLAQGQSPEEYFCAIRHSTPPGSKSVKSRMAQGLFSGIPMSTPKRSRTPLEVTKACQSSTFSTSKCIWK